MLCRIYKKKNIAKGFDLKEEELYTEASQMNNITAVNESNDEQTQQMMMMKFPRNCSLTHLLDMEYLPPISQLLSDASYNSTFDYQINSAYNNASGGNGNISFEMPNHYYAPSSTSQWL